jgi:hypothetical protein
MASMDGRIAQLKELVRQKDWLEHKAKSGKEKDKRKLDTWYRNNNWRLELLRKEVAAILKMRKEFGL